MRHEFARHIHSGIQAKRQTSSVNSLLKMMEPGWVPFARDEARAVIANESAVSGHLATVVAPGDKGVNDGVFGPGPHAVETAAAMARIFVVEGPDSKFELFPDGVLAESGSHPDSKGIPALAPIRWIIERLIQAGAEGDARPLQRIDRALQGELILLPNRERLGIGLGICGRTRIARKLARLLDLGEYSRGEEQETSGEGDPGTHKF